MRNNPRRLISAAGYFIMEITATVSIDLSGLQKFESKIDEQLAGGGEGPIAQCLELWAFRYRSYIQLRFDAYSKGGGNWRQLALSTIKKRRKGKSNVKMFRESLARNTKKKGQLVNAGGTYTILRDTGILFAALAPVFSNAPGAIEERIPFGIKVGYGGPQLHDAGGTATIADIASFHQNGSLPNLPQREIIVAPDDTLLRTMANDMTKALHESAS